MRAQPVHKACTAKTAFFPDPPNVNAAHGLKTKYAAFVKICGGLRLGEHGHRIFKIVDDMLEQLGAKCSVNHAVIH